MIWLQKRKSNKTACLFHGIYRKLLDRINGCAQWLLWTKIWSMYPNILNIILLWICLWYERSPCNSKYAWECIYVLSTEFGWTESLFLCFIVPPWNIEIKYLGNRILHVLSFIYCDKYTYWSNSKATGKRLWYQCKQVTRDSTISSTVC